MKISKKNKKIFSVTAIALIAVIVALLVIPSDVVLERKELSYTSDTQKGIDFSNSFKEYICVGNNVLCVDEKTGSIAFLNKQQTTSLILLQPMQQKAFFLQL